MEKLLKAKEVGANLGVSAQTVREWFHDGKIAGTILPGGDLRFAVSAVNAFVSNRTIRKTKKVAIS